MTQAKGIDGANLRWVSKEVEVSLADARSALETFAAGTEDTEPLKRLDQRVHQVHGALQLIELHGAAMFAQELADVVLALPKLRGEHAAQASEALMAGLVALPDYLAALQEGAPDVPVALLSIMNDLRAVRDAPLLSETSLFAPNLERQLDAEAELTLADAVSMREEVAKSRRDLHLGLLGWFRGDEAGSQAGLERLAGVLSRFQHAAKSVRVARVFESALAVVEGVRSGEVESSVAVKRLIGGLDRTIKSVAETGEQGFSSHANSLGTIKNFLYYAASGKGQATPLIKQLKERYNLSGHSSGTATGGDAPFLLGFSDDTLEQTRSLVREELLGIVNRLDVLQHTQGDSSEKLNEILSDVNRLSDTLGMMGMGPLHQRLHSSTQQLSSKLSEGVEPSPDDVFSLASDLVFVDSSLQGGALTKQIQMAESDNLLTELQGTAPQELKRFKATALAEVSHELYSVKEMVARHVESPQQSPGLDDGVQPLTKTAGALNMLGFAEAARLSERIATVIQSTRQTADFFAQPSCAADFAEALSGLDFYLELADQDDSEADHVLSYAMAAIDRLESEVPIPLESAADQTKAVDEMAAVALGSDSADLSASQSDLREDLEIRQAFNEEAQQHQVQIQQAASRWLENPDDYHALSNMRRGFHTLKGSGRMIGALGLAGLAWPLENLLNKVIGGQIEADKPVSNLIENAVPAMAELIDKEAVLTDQGHAEMDASQQKIARLAYNLAGDPIPEELIPAQTHQTDALLSEDKSDPTATMAVPLVAAAGLLAAGMKTAASPTDEDSNETSDGQVQTEFNEEPVSQESVEADQRTAQPIDSDTDPELITIFHEEQRDLLDQMETSYNRWEEGEEDAVGNLQRILHTLKGAARLADIHQVSDLSHAFETMLEALPVDSHSTAALQLGREACDGLMEQSDQLAAGGVVEPYNDLIDRLNQPLEVAVASTRDAADLEQGTAADAEMLAAPAQADEASEIDDTAVRPLLFAPPPPNQDVLTRRRSFGETERIRISLGLLDRLVDQTGEVGTYSSRLTEQHNQSGQDLSELEQTVDRLSQQLRRLEIEIEAQILFRHEREGDQEEDFDPLELDRFSTLQELSRSLTETVDDLANIASDLKSQARNSQTLLTQQGRVVVELQNALMRTRMVPFSQQVSRLERLVRQTCVPLGKQARLQLQGRETELDRDVLEKTMPLLEHLLRNAVSHGIELPQQRVQLGKPEEGEIVLSVKRDGMDVVLDVSDDGAGFNQAAIRQRAIELGLVDADQSLSDEEIHRLVFLPNVSAADEITQISGRGVGLDVVANQVSELGGTLDVTSVADQGSEFTIRLPSTLVITDALLVQVGSAVYAIPHASLESVVRIPKDQVEAYQRGDETGIEYAGHHYVLYHFNQFFDDEASLVTADSRWYPALLVQAGDKRVAVQVDGLLGARKIVVKGLGPQLAAVPWLLGGAILGDGRVALIADLSNLVRTTDIKQMAVLPPDEQALRQITVMVVDDSLTVRKVTSRLLERNNMRVVTAKDGAIAIASLQETLPDVILLDIEMPKMDGFEVARHVRNNPRTSDIPIIMITSRSGEKHRQRAHEIGVDNYLGKPYQEDQLMDAIFEVLAGVA
jgi:chemotaxis protein histidine kinase CheA/ActR/RegA family two-component response regulator